MEKSSKPAKTAIVAKQPETGDVAQHEAKLDELVAALGPKVIEKIPPNTTKRAEHLLKFADAIAADSAMLLKVPLRDGGPLQPWELAVFPVAVKSAKKLGDAVRSDKSVPAAALSKADAALLATVRADQAMLLSAFRRLLFKGMSARLDEMRAIEAGDPADVIDACNDSTALLAIAEHEDHRAWFASLPLGEPEAAARLKQAQPRLEELATIARSDKAAVARRERLRRVWTVIGQIERRVREAAEYLFHGQARREKYVAYVGPVTRKPKVAAVGAPTKKKTP